MFFTQDDYKKIQQWLTKNSVKDTEFNEANIPFNGEETITIVQGNQNKKVFLKDLIAQVFNLGISDFVNITDKYDAPNISLEEAIRLIPSRARKTGQVITFLNKDDNWQIYQFKGALNQWNVLDTWKDLFDLEESTIETLLPDEEDLTKSITDEEGNSYLSLKNRDYNPKDFSGLGRVILRKNIVEIEDPVYGKVKNNILNQDMINKTNTIYEIRYDFDLNGREITIPEGCVLNFQGGSIYNGCVIFNSVLLEGNVRIYSDFKGDIINEHLNVLWFGAKNDRSQDVSPIVNKIINAIYAIKKPFFNTELNISKTIYFPAGQYLINDSIVFKNDNNINGHYSAINILGESKGSTIIQTNTDGIQGVFKFSGSNYNFIENVTIVSSNWSYSSRNSGIGLLLDNWCNQIAIRDVVCRGFDIGLKATVQASSMNNIMARDCKIGFEITSTSLTMINCYAGNNKTNDGDGVGYLFHGNYCSLLNCASDSNNIAYKIVNSVNATIKGCGCEGNDYGIYIDAEDSSNPFEKITIDDCSLLGVNNTVPIYINNKNMQVDIINQVLDVSKAFINYGPNANKDIINFNNCSTVRSISSQANNKYPIIYGKDNFKKLPYDGDVYRANRELFRSVNTDTTTLIEGDLYISKSNGAYTTFDINIKSLTSYTDGNLKPDINVRISVIGYSATYCILNTRYPEGISVVTTMDYDNSKLHYSVGVSEGYYTNYGHIQILGDIIASHSLSNIMNSTMNIA